MVKQSPVQLRLLPGHGHMILPLLVLCVGLLVAWRLEPQAVQAQTETEQTTYETLYIEATGHYITDEYGFLNYWRTHDGERMLGAPVTELLIENGLIVQYFERGRLESHIGVDGKPVMLGHVGAEFASALWLDFRAASPQAEYSGAYIFESTGHTLQEPFLSFWRQHDGFNTLGYPISELRWEYVGNDLLEVQYFERGRLEHHPQASDPAQVVQISSLGLALALLRGYDTSPIGPAALRAHSEQQAERPEPLAGNTPLSSTDVVSDTAEPAAEPAPEPEPAPAPPIPQGATPPQETFYKSSPSAEEADWEVASEPLHNTSKRVIVNLSLQRLFAYDGTTLVYDAPISTGMDGFETPKGDFFIYARNPLQTMSGDLGGEYSVPNVPNSMYIVEDVAIHGTYWHNQFGTGVRRSHGCINLPLDAAAWLYNWAPVGTPVRVTSEVQ